MNKVEIYKGLEFWTVINLTDFFILLSFFNFGLVLARSYIKSYEEALSLRVSLEFWRILVDISIDFLLFINVLLGIVFLNPDIMADIKVGLPFLPLALVLLTPALILRVFYNGKGPGKSETLVFVLLLLAAISNLIGYTFIMESAGEEWLEIHPQSFWGALRQMRSNLNLQLSMTCFYFFYPIFCLESLWAIIAGIRSRKKALKPKEETQ